MGMTKDSNTVNAMDIAKTIELLLQYAERCGLIAGLDIVLSRNLLMDLLRISAPFEDETVRNDSHNHLKLDDMLPPIFEYAYKQGIIESDSIESCDLFEAKIMGLLTPRQSEVIGIFNTIKETQGIKAAADYFYKLSTDTNYIKTERIKKNLYWTHTTAFGELQITVNLSKPEKDPRDIAKALKAAHTAYPKCLLCVENVGFAGHYNHPARQNHRIIPIKLGGEDWYFQYSPYSYFNEHGIPLRAKHTPIHIGRGTFERLVDFLEIFPHYFVGGNAGLPIVGGSILNHDHFQSGLHTFPIQSAAVIQSYWIGANNSTGLVESSSNDATHGVRADILRWPMSVIRLTSESRDKIIDAASLILEKWQGYSDMSVEIAAFSGDMPHNAITPIARINPDGAFEFDLVLRNSRTSEAFPDGIFHPHPHVHHIKKENIGLIEVMGLAILPGRLAAQVTHAANRQQEEAYIGDIFLEVLSHAGVFKMNDEGVAAFKRFMDYCGAVSE